MLLLIASLFGPAADAADATKPHPHQGVLPAWSGAPPVPTLTADELATLATGKPVTKQSQTASGSDAAGHALAVQDIHATPDVIWGRITDFADYPKMVDNVKECEPYEVVGDHIKVRFVIGAPLVSIEYFIDHTYHPEQGWM